MTATDPKTEFRLITQLRVRYGECDLQGIIFNANYLAFADVGLTEYMRALMADVQPDKPESEMLDGFMHYFGGDNWARHADVDFVPLAKRMICSTLPFASPVLGGPAIHCYAIYCAEMSCLT